MFFWYPMIQRFWYPMIQRFWYPWTKRFWYPMIQRFYVKGGAKPPTCRDMCYHRYPEMSRALSYRLRAVPSVKGLRPSFIKGFGKFSLLCFYKNVFATHQLFYFRIFIFIWTSFFICSFFWRCGENGFDKGVRKGAEGPQWTKCFSINLSSLFLQPMIKRF